MSTRPLNVAVIGAGPAGIYAADILSKSGLDVKIDILEALPAPYGLVRYGVAPDHPRIKQIIVALYNILQRGDIRLLGNVHVGKDVTIDQLRDYYDAIIIATGADRDAPLNIPGAQLPQCYGAADFVYWYDGHPNYPRTWPLQARQVAVLGAGNVALDVARILAKPAQDLLATEIPANVAAGLADNRVSDVHVFGRRGPAQVKFSPLELRELGKVNDVDVIVYEEDFEFDEGSQEAINASNQTKQVVKALTNYALIDPQERTASRRIHLHLFHRPVQVLADENGQVCALRTERTELIGDGSVRGTGCFVDTPVQAVYRAVGYYSSPLPGVPFDEAAGVIPNQEGRVVDADATPIAGLYATGWIKRGPVGLIGSTKSDAQQTIGHLVADAQAGLIGPGTAADQCKSFDCSATSGGIIELLEQRKVPYTTWQGWELLDQFEQQLGANFAPLADGSVRERVKVVSAAAMTAISRGSAVPDDLIGEVES